MDFNRIPPINGIKEWDSFSKAKYIADVHEKYDVDLIAIAQKSVIVTRQSNGFTEATNCLNKLNCRLDLKEQITESVLFFPPLHCR